jgi:hypothetical protein
MTPSHIPSTCARRRAPRPPFPPQGACLGQVLPEVGAQRVRHVGQLHPVLGKHAGALLVAARGAARRKGEAVLAADGVAVGRAVGRVQRRLHHHALQRRRRRGGWGRRWPAQHCTTLPHVLPHSSTRRLGWGRTGRCIPAAGVGSRAGQPLQLPLAGPTWGRSRMMNSATSLSLPPWMTPNRWMAAPPGGGASCTYDGGRWSGSLLPGWACPLAPWDRSGACSAAAAPCRERGAEPRTCGGAW